MELSLKAKILLIDDSPEVRMVVSRILRKGGFEVLDARTGEDGIQAAIRELPDAIILDVNLPDMTGFDVCKDIKTHPVTSRIPVIYLSAMMASTSAKIEGLQAGAEAYITKPLEPGVLFATINLVLRLRRSENELTLLGAHWAASLGPSANGICLTDEKGVVLRANAAFCTLLDISVRDVVGRLWREAAVKRGWNVVERILDHAEREELRIGVTLQKGEITLSMTSDLLADATDRIIGAAHVVSPR